MRDTPAIRIAIEALGSSSLPEGLGDENGLPSSIFVADDPFEVSLATAASAFEKTSVTIALTDVHHVTLAIAHQFENHS